MNSIDKLAEYFKEFPGIGPRQARRFVYFLLRKNKNFSVEMAELIPKIKDEVSICDRCFRYFPKTNSNLCDTCSDKNRDASKLMVVTRDVDYEAIEKSGEYNGYYFILGGIVPMMEKDYQKFVRIKELNSTITKQKPSGLDEVILALNANPEGDNTSGIVASKIEDKDLKVTILGRGLATGSELEYADKDTIKNALTNRN
jgi:recombination protein RecR